MTRPAANKQLSRGLQEALQRALRIALERNRPFAIQRDVLNPAGVFTWSPLHQSAKLYVQRLLDNLPGGTRK
jgi:hypothetical protein